MTTQLWQRASYIGACISRTTLYLWRMYLQ